MAKKQFSLNFKKCVIDTDNREITEISNDETEVFDLDSVLRELEGKVLDITFREVTDYSSDNR